MLIKLPAVFGGKAKTTILTDNGIHIKTSVSHIEIKTQYRYEEPVDEDDETLGTKITTCDEETFALKSNITQIGLAYDNDYEIYYVCLKIGNFSAFINCLDKKAAAELYTNLKNWLYGDS